jgi:cyclophilin family peptidyl-prolyl cis-trans isomerase
MNTVSPTRHIGFVVIAGALALASCGDGPVEPAAEAAAAEGTTTVAAEQAGDSGTDSTSGDDGGSAEPSDASVVTTPADPATGKPSVILPTVMPTELVITEVIEGSGDPITVGDTVVVHYVGVRSADGTEFDNSYDGDQPIELTIGTTGVIPGFAQGLIGARLGGRRQIDIPAPLAYGDSGAGDIIQPGDVISFVVEIVSVSAPVPITAPPMADPGDCPATDGSETPQQEFTEYPPFCIDITKTYTAEIETNFGNITIELFPEKAPLTVNSFVTLAWFHYFDGTTCHRAIPSFVVQCGDPTATGTGGPGYRFADELPAGGEYQIGSLAMANSGPDTNGSQFFIITGPQGAALPPQYSLFGQVVAGTSTVAEMDGVANPDNNGVPPLDQIIIDSVTITAS